MKPVPGNRCSRLWTVREGLVVGAHGKEFAPQSPALKVLGGHRVPSARLLVVPGTVEVNAGKLVVFQAGGEFALDLEAAKVDASIEAINGQPCGCSVFELHPVHIGQILDIAPSAGDRAEEVGAEAPLVGIVAGRLWLYVGDGYMVVVSHQEAQLHFLNICEIAQIEIVD